MQVKYDKYGKAYIPVTEEMIRDLPKRTKIYNIETSEGDTVKGIVPPDCKHEFEISPGVPSNIRGCKKCIFWEFC